MRINRPSAAALCHDSSSISCAGFFNSGSTDLVLLSTDLAIGAFRESLAGLGFRRFVKSLEVMVVGPPSSRTQHTAEPLVKLQNNPPGLPYRYYCTTVIGPRKQDSFRYVPNPVSWYSSLVLRDTRGPAFRSDTA